jgi:hypothetical protein
MKIDQGPWLTGVALLLVISGCHKDKPEEPANTGGGVVVGHGVYITNEGNFQWGNASVSYYDPASGDVTEDLYENANGSGIGDVCQSMCLHGGKAYIVVNNSGKVEVVDPNSFISAATITGFTSPRYLLPVGGNKAYVSELYGGQLRVVDLAANSISGSIPCAGATQEMVLAQGKAFITNESRKYVYVVDTATDLITDSVLVGQGGNSIVKDIHGKVWVACSGGAGTPPAIVRIDPQDATLEASFTYPGAANAPWRLRINGGGDTLYFLKDGVYRMPITASAAPSSAFIPADGRNLYSLGVDPLTGTIYLGDAVDYVQHGVVYRYRPDGSAVGSFQAGIIPGSFCFR